MALSKQTNMCQQTRMGLKENVNRICLSEENKAEFARTANSVLRNF